MSEIFRCHQLLWKLPEPPRKLVCFNFCRRLLSIFCSHNISAFHYKNSWFFGRSLQTNHNNSCYGLNEYNTHALNFNAAPDRNNSMALYYWLLLSARRSHSNGVSKISCKCHCGGTRVTATTSQQVLYLKKVASLRQTVKILLEFVNRYLLRTWILKNVSDSIFWITFMRGNMHAFFYKQHL